MEQNDNVASPTVSVLDIKLCLPFGPASRNLASEGRDLLLAPPAKNACQTLKETLIRRFTPSELEHLQQLLREPELGDRRPSELWRHMQQLTGCTASVDSRLVRELFLQRLPANVLMGITASGETNLPKMAEPTDKLMAVATPTVASLHAEVSPTRVLLEMRK
nr:uncharacterized protein LOC126534876 [Dermacentor andersoni]